jgi:hypothetical protein
MNQESVKDCGFGHIHARTEVFVALCLRLVITDTNYERGNAPG